MAIYLMKFETHTQYENYINGSDAILPNVSICTTEGDVHYNPYVEPETRVVAKFNVTSTSNPTKIGYNRYISGFSAIEIDGVEQPSVVSAYTFSTTGEHIVKYTLKNPLIIGSKSFQNCYSLTSIDIPDSVTSIGSAFAFCSGLTSCTIGSGITSIGNDAFEYCTSLTSIDIPDSVTSIGSQAFLSCNSITSCTIGSGITSIGNDAFEYCTSLTSIDIPDSVTSIGGSAFYGCRSLASITVNATTPPTLVDMSAFGDTDNCPIYVPSASVDTYKSATNWSSYANRIEAIS